MPVYRIAMADHDSSRAAQQHTNRNGPTYLNPMPVVPINDTPTVETHNYTTPEDTALTVSAPGVLTGASDGDGDVVTVAGYTQPAHGNAIMQADGSFEYVPAKDYSGPDSWGFNATDCFGGYAPGIVNVDVGE